VLDDAAFGGASPSEHDHGRGAASTADASGRCGILTPENIKRTIRHGRPGLPRLLIRSLSSGSHAASARGAGPIGSRDWRRNSALRSPFAIYWIDFLMTACGELRREASAHQARVAFICRTWNSRARRMPRPA
jgi:hypothetical protein